MFLELTTGPLTEVATGRHWEPTEIQRQVAMRIDRYRSFGLNAGDRVMLHFGNRMEFFAELIAIWRLGGCAIPMDGRLTVFEVETVANAADACFRVIDDQTNPAIITAVDGPRVVETLEPAPDPANATPIKPVLRLDDDALILFTSGSTGDPKGVVHTHRSLRTRWITLRQSLGIAAYRRTLCLLPTHFGHGLICNSLYPWLAGCELYIAPPFKPDLIMKLGALIDEHQITFMSSVPSVWNLALKIAKPPSDGSLRRIHVGSASLSAALWMQIQDWAGINEVFNAYGITETGSWVAGTTGGLVTPENGLIGAPWGATIKVLNAHDTRRTLTPDMECRPGEVGMIWLNTPALMKGYFLRQDLTDAVVADGWFMTGDIGVIDDHGRLLIRDRKRDEINKGGMKVFPADVDAVVEQFAGVTDVCTFGYADDAYGDNVGIALVIENPKPKSVQALFDWITLHLAEHKRPVRWYLVDEIPRTSRGKVNRTTVMETCLQQTPLDLKVMLNNS